MWRVDLVGENIIGSRLGDRQVEASYQFSQVSPSRRTSMAKLSFSSSAVAPIRQSLGITPTLIWPTSVSSSSVSSAD
jgi:hypothetical protein